VADKPPIFIICSKKVFAITLAFTARICMISTVVVPQVWCY